VNTLQTQQTELEKARSASLRGWKAKALGGRCCLTVREGANKQASEVTKLFLLGSSCCDREEGDEEIVEGEARVDNEPVSRARFSGQSVANVASEASTKLQAVRLRTLREVSRA